VQSFAGIPAAEKGSQGILMSGVLLVACVWGAVAVSLIGIFWRVLAIARQPIHLRWELAPIPREKSRGNYGGSYLEEYEWWKKSREKSTIAPLIYMAREIFLLHSVRIHNRSLWPFSFALHLGIYFLLAALFFHALSLISPPEPRTAFSGIHLEIASRIAFCGYLLGTLGAVGLLMRRFWAPDIRGLSPAGAYFNLFLLGAVFVSGAWAWLYSADRMHEADRIIRGLIAFNEAPGISPPFAVHVVLFSLCCVCLPFTNMVHFVQKYFTYHSVMWNDKPLDSRMERQLNHLLSQPVQWETADPGKERSWTEVVSEKAGDEKTQS
jgi:nitrate reductase gamma subunit